MSLSLTKIQIQEVLREMGVKISHKSTYEELVEIYRKENHKRWLGISDDPRITPKAERVKGFVRRRPGNLSSKMERIEPVSQPNRENSETHLSAKANESKEPEFPQKSLNDNPPVSDVSPDVDPDIDNDKQAVPAILNKNIRDMVMKRAKGCCELCEKSADNEENHEDATMQLFDLLPESDSVNKTVKSVVALCSDCYKRMCRERQKKDISKLKKMARRRISAPLVVMEKKASGSLLVRRK